MNKVVTNRLIHQQIQNLFANFRRIIAVMLGVVSVFMVCFINSPLPIYAQTTPAPANQTAAGFSKCQFNPRTMSSQEVSIQNCLGQIFQFTFVVGMFIIAIRVALFALGNYNPFDNGKAINQSINIVWEATLGFILLGTPVVIIGLINPAALNLSFLDIGSLNPANQTAQDNPDTSGSTTTVSGDSLSTPNGPITAQNANQSCDVVTGYSLCEPEKSTSAIPQLQSPFLAVNTYAQTGDASMTQERAEKIISDILGAELECKKLFVTKTDLDNCKVLDTPAFISVRNRYTQRARELLTPLVEPAQSYSGSIYLTRPIEVLPVSLSANKTNKNDCFIRYASIKDLAFGNIYLVATESCAGNNPSSALWKVDGDAVTANIGANIDAGSEVMQSGTIQLMQ